MFEIKEESPKTPFEVISSIFSNIASFILNSIEAIIIALAFSVVLYLFIATPHEVVGRSMMPNFVNGEFLIANKLVYKLQEPNHGDVIIFKHSETEDYIKRIIALPGDTLSLQDGHYTLNGTLLDESEYLASSVVTSGGQYLHEGETITIKEGTVFVSGDNRPHSSDSRDFGPIAISSIKGKAWIVFFPFTNFRIVQHPGS